jgi:hypothetical protein
MTTIIKNIKYSENFIITAWRYAPGKAKGAIIASHESWYYSEVAVLETRDDGWEKICLNFFVPVDLDGKEVSVYLFNSEKEPVYFDDLEIRRYQSTLK